MDLRERSARFGVRHPWERARLDFLLRVLARHGGLRARAVLDVGAGDAFVACGLLPHLPFDATADVVDAAYDATRIEALALPPRVRPSTTLADTDAGAPFDLALMLDVAEHVRDDHALVASVAARLAPDGMLLFTVPAWPALFTQHDTALGHHRRYTPAGARALLEGAGLQVVETGGVFHGLLLPRALAAVGERLRPPTSARSDGEAQFSQPLSDAITWALVREQRVTHALARRGVALPGLSIYALARRAR